MLKALYYPHTDIKSPVIIKNALLLWDSIETIVPHPRWRSWRKPGDKFFNEAVDLVVKPRVPSTVEKNAAHKSLIDLLRSGFPSSLIRSTPHGWGHRDFFIYPDKFLRSTWHALNRGGMARWVASEHDYGVPPAVGLLMMSILAESCAGTQIQKVTDRVDAYSWLSEHYARLLGSQCVSGFDASQVAPAYDRLVSLSLKALDAREVPLRKLVEFRKRELRRGGSDFSAFRRRYADRLQYHLVRIGKEGKSPGDVRELERQFQEEMKQDLADLKEELGLASKKALLSKEVVLSALILAGSFAAPIAGLTTLASTVGGIGVIPLMRAAVKYRGARREALKRHTMSWVFLATRGRLTVR